MNRKKLVFVLTALLLTSCVETEKTGETTPTEKTPTAVVEETQTEKATATEVEEEEKEVNTPQQEQEISDELDAFLQDEFNLEDNNLVKIENQTENYVRGTIEEEGKTSFTFLLAKENGKWQTVYSGNGEYNCSEVEGYDFPAEMISDCTQEESSDDKEEETPICEDLCGDGTCQEVVCQGSGCPCPEDAESCPEDCQE